LYFPICFADDTKKPLKGFLLWFDENSARVSGEENIIDQDKLRDQCLKLWQDMSKEDKEDYKTPRFPKRKRDNHDHGSNLTSSKLAKFAAK
jgi:hypothetical protein